MSTLREQVEGLPFFPVMLNAFDPAIDVVKRSDVLALLPAQEAGAQEPVAWAERIRAITGIPLSRAAFVVACLENAKTKLPGSSDVIDDAIREEQAIARLLDELLYAPLPAAAPAQPTEAMVEAAARRIEGEMRREIPNLSGSEQARLSFVFADAALSASRRGGK